MNRTLYTLFFLFLAVLTGSANSLDDLKAALEQSSVTQVQEKVYVHTDNTCYFVGDTLWYKAYVVRADNFQPTDMSHILYVELLSPDGLLVERQNIIVAPDNYTCGQFVLKDSLYSGYYELRAYTRWNLNFNQREHRFDKVDGWAFYNRKMAEEYYRLWDGLYSRVLPIYSKPEESGDFDERRMYQRPKTRLPKPKKEELVVTFFPEGGSLVEGLTSRVAFEAVDQHGQAVDVKGTVWAGDQQVADAATGYMGRGSFAVTPGSQRLKARFQWHDKDYTFDLPKAERAGAVITLDGSRLQIAARNLPLDRQYAVSVLCRGVLKHFEEVGIGGTNGMVLTLPVDSLPVGVNDITLFDSDGQILADRLFFVSGTHETNESYGTNGANIEPIESINPLHTTTTYAPYEPITIGLQLPTPETTFSLAVRDTRTDEPTYDNGNIMTSMLLSSELRGFIARPAYYFESDDEEHRRNLDLLMMVQGWRKYKWQQLADTTFVPQYQPETTMTVSGAVYKMLSIIPVGDLPLEEPLGIAEVGVWHTGTFTGGEDKFKRDEGSPGETTNAADYSEDSDDYGSDSGQETAAYTGPLTSDVSSILGVNHKGMRRELMVEAELYTEDGMVAAVQKTHDGGRFVFEIPPFYGTTFLNMKAYKEKDTIRKSMLSRSDKEYYKEDAYPDYYVKRDMPYPVFTDDYNFYQNHAPEWDPSMEEVDTLSLLSMENDVYQLRNVDVKGRRRGRRATDWTKPAFVRDAYDLYNDLTDYGLSYGMYDMRMFPQQVATFLYGNMGRHTKINIDGRLNDRTYWRNYPPLDRPAEALDMEEMRAPQALYNNLLLSRLQNVRIYSDYEPRKEDSTMVESSYIADMTVEMEPFADDCKQVVFRDRHIYLHGMSEPAEFYQPDYSRRPVDEKPADYRRTLYWNPNARTDEDGRFITTFFNNGKDTRIKISAAGVSPDGRLLFSR
jgi:hypothetical protein